MAGLFTKLVAFVASLSSYSGGVAVAAGVSSSISAVFGFYFTSSVQLDLGPYLTTLALTLLGISTVIHGMQFGLFAKLGIGGWTKAVRVLNKNITTKPIRLKPDLDPATMREVWRAINYIPFTNSLTGAFWATVVVTPLLVLGYLRYEHKEHILIFGSIQCLITIIIHAGFTFILSEIVTGGMRADVQARLVSQTAEVQFRVPTVRFKQIAYTTFFVTGVYIAVMLTYYNRDNLESIIVFSITALLSAMFMVYLIFYRLFQTLKDMAKAMENLTQGGDGMVFCKSLDLELNQLAVGINTASRRLRDYQNNLEHKVADRTEQLVTANSELEDRNRRLQMELSLAEAIQQNILPDSLAPWNGLEFRLLYRPVGKVSGDYYDYFEAGDWLYLIITDVSGHGMPAALITMAAKQAFSRYAGEEMAPAEICRAMDIELGQQINTGDFASAIVIRIKPEPSGELLMEYTTAGHPPLLFYRADTKKVMALKTQGLLMGALRDASLSFETKEIRIMPGDRVLLYTDGLIEAQGYAQEDRYGQTRLVSAMRSSNDLDEWYESSLEDWHLFTRNASRLDDVSMVFLEYNAAWPLFNHRFEQAEAAYRRGELEIAKTEYLRAYELLPKESNVLTALAKLSYQQKEYRQAVRYSDNYLDNHPKNLEMRKVLLQAQIQLGLWSKASETLMRLEQWSRSKPYWEKYVERMQARFKNKLVRSK